MKEPSPAVAITIMIISVVSLILAALIGVVFNFPKLVWLVAVVVLLWSIGVLWVEQ